MLKAYFAEDDNGSDDSDLEPIPFHCWNDDMYREFLPPPPKSQPGPTAEDQGGWTSIYVRRPRYDADSDEVRITVGWCLDGKTPREETEEPLENLKALPLEDKQMISTMLMSDGNQTRKLWLSLGSRSRRTSSSGHSKPCDRPGVTGCESPNRHHRRRQLQAAKRRKSAVTLEGAPKNPAPLEPVTLQQHERFCAFNTFYNLVRPTAPSMAPRLAALREAIPTDGFVNFVAFNNLVQRWTGCRLKQVRLTFACKSKALMPQCLWESLQPGQLYMALTATHVFGIDMIRTVVVDPHPGAPAQTAFVGQFDKACEAYRTAFDLDINAILSIFVIVLPAIC